MSGATSGSSRRRAARRHPSSGVRSRRRGAVSRGVESSGCGGDHRHEVRPCDLEAVRPELGRKCADEQTLNRRARPRLPRIKSGCSPDDNDVPTFNPAMHIKTPGDKHFLKFGHLDGCLCPGQTIAAHTNLSVKAAWQHKRVVPGLQQIFHKCRVGFRLDSSFVCSIVCKSSGSCVRLALDRFVGGCRGT